MAADLPRRRRRASARTRARSALVLAMGLALLALLALLAPSQLRPGQPTTERGHITSSSSPICYALAPPDQEPVFASKARPARGNTGSPKPPPYSPPKLRPPAGYPTQPASGGPDLPIAEYRSFLRRASTREFLDLWMEIVNGISLGHVKWNETSTLHHHPRKTMFWKNRAVQPFETVAEGITRILNAYLRPVPSLRPADFPHFELFSLPQRSIRFALVEAILMNPPLVRHLVRKLAFRRKRFGPEMPPHVDELIGQAEEALAGYSFGGRGDVAGAVDQLLTAAALGSDEANFQFAAYALFDEEFAEQVNVASPQARALRATIAASRVLEENPLSTAELTVPAHVLAVEALQYAAWMHCTGARVLQGLLLQSGLVLPNTASPQADALLLYRQDASEGSLLGHLALATHFTAKRELPRGGSPRELDCDRGAAHLVFISGSVLDSINDVMAGNGRHERISFLWEDAAVDVRHQFARFYSRDDYMDEVVHFEDEVRHGEPAALNALGELRYFGAPAAGVPGDPGAALPLFEQAHDAGSGVASSFLGAMYSNGDGVPRDNKTAFEYFQAAAGRGEAAGHNGLGYFYLEGGVPGVAVDPLKALEHFTTAANAGHSEADNNIALMFMHGRGVQRNETRALLHYARAANAGHVVAIYMLGLAAWNGWGTLEPRSCERAVRQLSRVALGDWLDGLPFGTDKGLGAFLMGHYPMSLRNYLVAAELGERVAGLNAAFLLERMSNEEVIRAYARSDIAVMGTAVVAAEPVHVAKEKNSDLWLSVSRSLLQVYRPRFMPVWAPANPDLGLEISRFRLEQLFARYKHLALQGVGEALRKMGDCHATAWPYVCQRDLLTAGWHYVEGMANRDGQAAFALAQMFETGADGIYPQNDTRALRLYSRAARIDPLGFWPSKLARISLQVRRLARSVWAGEATIRLPFS